LKGAYRTGGNGGAQFLPKKKTRKGGTTLSQENVKLAISVNRCKQVMTVVEERQIRQEKKGAFTSLRGKQKEEKETKLQTQFATRPSEMLNRPEVTTGGGAVGLHKRQAKTKNEQVKKTKVEGLRRGKKPSKLLGMTGQTGRNGPTNQTQKGKEK